VIISSTKMANPRLLKQNSGKSPSMPIKKISPQKPQSDAQSGEQLLSPVNSLLDHVSPAARRQQERLLEEEKRKKNEKELQRRVSQMIQKKPLG